MHFDYKQFERKGFDIISLYYIDQANDEKKEIWVLPGHGMNLCKYTVNNLRIIEFDSDKIREGFYGTPLFYPTTNRIFNEYPQVKEENLVTIHELLHNEPFKGIEISKTEGSISVCAYIDFVEKNHLFEAFPFRHRLNVKYTLDKSGVRFDYEIVNKEPEQRIPFAIGLNTYFSKIDGEDKTFIKAPFELPCKRSEELTPTDELPAINEEFNLANYVAIGSLDSEIVFAGNKNNEPANIIYSKSGLKITLRSSEDFSNMVIYTQKGKPFFCMENHSCASDAHNLCNQGMEDISGLKFVEANSTFRGFMHFVTEKI